MADIRRLLLSPATNAPSGFVLSGKVICQCFNVSEETITAALGDISGEPGVRYAVLQSQLKCGTNCGSCTPELRQLVARTPIAERQEAT